MTGSDEALAGHPDRDRWNARHRARPATFRPHPLAERALAVGLPAGPAADLACGPSGSALLIAARGRRVEAVDVSEVALGLLAEEAGRRGLADLIATEHADLARWRPGPDGYALVLCTGFWDAGVFATAAAAVRPGGLIAWEAFTGQARGPRGGLPKQWLLEPGEPASLLPADFEVIEVKDVAGAGRGPKRRLLARRHG